MDIKIISSRQYRNDQEHPNEFIVAECRDYESERRFQARFRREDIVNILRNERWEDPEYMHKNR